MNNEEIKDSPATVAPEKTREEIGKEAIEAKNTIKSAYFEMVKGNGDKYEEYQAFLTEGKIKLQEVINKHLPMFAIKVTISDGAVSTPFTVGLYTHKEIAAAKKIVLENELEDVFKKATEKVIVVELVDVDDYYHFTNNMCGINDVVSQYAMDNIVSLCKKNLSKKKKSN